MTHFDPRAVFHAMCEASRAHKMPERFRTDLTKHDRRFLREHDGSPFGWILYEHGTHVLQHDATRKPSKRGMARKVAENFGAGTTYPAARFYAWDGAAFREVPKDEWIEILTEPPAPRAIPAPGTLGRGPVEPYAIRIARMLGPKGEPWR